MQAWADKIRGVMESDRTAEIERILQDPFKRKVMLSMRGMLEFEAVNTPQPVAYQLITLVGEADRPFLEPVLAFAAWSIKPEHFQVDPLFKSFDMRPIKDIPLFLKIIAEALESGSLSAVLPEATPSEQAKWAEAFLGLRSYGPLDLTVSFDPPLLTVNTGTGRLHFPKVNKALLSNVCRACTKKNKEGAVKCFGCKRAL